MKFPVGTIVKHVKKGSYYVILIGPDVGRLEKTWEPAYSYKDFKTGLVAHRCQEEMEDGRFVLPTQDEIVKNIYKTETD